jgi:hypothetical protein
VLLLFCKSHTQHSITFATSTIPVPCSVSARRTCPDLYCVGAAAVNVVASTAIKKLPTATVLPPTIAVVVFRCRSRSGETRDLRADTLGSALPGRFLENPQNVNLKLPDRQLQKLMPCLANYCTVFFTYVFNGVSPNALSNCPAKLLSTQILV